MRAGAAVFPLDHVAGAIRHGLIGAEGALRAQFSTMTPLLLRLPTATTVPSPSAVTARSSIPLGEAMMLQLVPSQCSMSGPKPVAPPTAQMSLAETAAIPFR